MEKLMKPAEYAQELGISRQAVYAKIKRGILKSKNVDGKLYIVLDNDTKIKETNVKKEPSQKRTDARSEKTSSSKDYKALLEAKDETISVLKETVLDLKESNKQISTTLRSEVDLLKEAFHEMRTLYVHQLEYKKTLQHDEDAIEIHTEDEVPSEEAKSEDVQWIGLKKFFKQKNISKTKKQEKTLKRLKKAYKKGDTRLMIIKGKFKLNQDENYEDILN